MKICENPECKKKFKPKRPWQRFCDTPCRWAVWDKEHPRLKKEKPQD